MWLLLKGLQYLHLLLRKTTSTCTRSQIAHCKSHLPQLHPQRIKRLLALSHKQHHWPQVMQPQWAQPGTKPMPRPGPQLSQWWTLSRKRWLRLEPKHQPPSSTWKSKGVRLRGQQERQSCVNLFVLWQSQLQVRAERKRWTRYELSAKEQPWEIFEAAQPN